MHLPHLARHLPRLIPASLAVVALAAGAASLGAVSAASAASPILSGPLRSHPGIVASTTTNPLVNVNGLACATKAVCFAVGYKSTDSSGFPSGAGVVRSVNGGGKFASVTIPSGFVSVTGIACPSSTACYATAEKSSGAGAVIWTVNPTATTAPTWKTKSLPGGTSSPFAQPTSVACPKSSRCYVAGADLTAAGQAPAIEELSISSSTMTTVAMQLPPSNPAAHTPTVLNGISCATITSCLAVGGDASQVGSAETLVSGRWLQVTTFPTTSPTAWGASCRLNSTKTNTYCAVAASTFGNPPSGALYSAKLVGTKPTWTHDKVPSDLGGMFAVTCVSSTQCLASGMNLNGNGAEIVGTKTTTTFSDQKLPTGAGPLDSVTCSTAAECLAGGENPSFTHSQVFRSTTFSTWTFSGV